eukprot:1107880-Rhodomonas_salina.2
MEISGNGFLGTNPRACYAPPGTDIALGASDWRDSLSDLSEEACRVASLLLPDVFPVRSVILT